MAGYETQLEGNIQLGTGPGSVTDYSLDISALVINRRRNTVTKPGTFGNPVVEEKASTNQYTVTAVFAGNEGDATGVWAEIWDAMDTDASEVYFEGTFKEGAVSASNPKFTGYIIVTDTDAGGTVGELKQQSKTWPARGVVGPLFSES
jgi:hypothetical protein